MYTIEWDVGDNWKLKPLTHFFHFHKSYCVLHVFLPVIISLFLFPLLSSSLSLPNSDIFIHKFGQHSPFIFTYRS